MRECDVHILKYLIKILEQKKTKMAMSHSPEVKIKTVFNCELVCTQRCQVCFLLIVNHVCLGMMAILNFRWQPLLCVWCQTALLAYNEHYIPYSLGYKTFPSKTISTRMVVRGCPSTDNLSSPLLLK